MEVCNCIRFIHLQKDTIMFRGTLLTLVVAAAVCIGCGTKTTTEGDAPTKPAGDAAKFFLTEEPAGAKSVVDVKTNAKDGDEVTLIGRIGGSDSPFVSGRASFTIVDTSFVPCNERPDDACETPWDYCCATDLLPGGTATVKIVDAEGATLAKDAKQDLALKELQTIVVKGKAKRDEAGNLIVLAPAVFVKK
jgi:hypothetical protein